MLVYGIYKQKESEGKEFIIAFRGTLYQAKMWGMHHFPQDKILVEEIFLPIKKRAPGQEKVKLFDELGGEWHGKLPPGGGYNKCSK